MAKVISIKQKDGSTLEVETQFWPETDSLLPNLHTKLTVDLIPINLELNASAGNGEQLRRDVFLISPKGMNLELEEAINQDS